MQKELKELIKLAKDFSKFSQMSRGWTCQHYGKVWCYFSNDRRHSAVHFNNFNIALFNPARIECDYGKLTVKFLTNLVKKYREELDNLKSEYKKKTKGEIALDKFNEMKALKKRLSELEEEDE